MRKAIDFIKKPLLIISSIVFAIFAVVLIAVSSQSHGKKYEYSETFFGVNMDITFTFKSKSTVELEMAVAGEYTSDVYQYKIDDGDLYTYNSETKTWGYDGEIDAFELELYLPAEALESTQGMEIELVCKQNQNIKTLSIVMIAVFGVLAAGSAAVLVLDKKGMLKFLFKNQEAPATPAADAQPVEAAQAVPTAPVVEAAPEAPASPVEQVAETTPAEPEVQVEVKKETDSNN